MRNTIIYLYINHSSLYLNKFVLIPTELTPKAGSSSSGEIGQGQKVCFDFLQYFPEARVSNLPVFSFVRDLCPIK